MSCGRTIDPYICPKKPALLRAIWALLPRGRAWQTHDGLRPRINQDGKLDDDASWMERYWGAYAELLAHLHARACKLLSEKFCFLADETLDLWRADYGLPDACDPYDKVCEKVAATGGSRCEYYKDMAARRGWSIVCGCLTTTPGCLEIGGLSLACECAPATLYVKVLLADSPAFTRPNTSCDYADIYDPCGPNVAQVACLLERYVPAHLDIIYEVIP